MAQSALLGTLFVLAAVALTGLPPLAGFVGKIMILRSTAALPEAGAIWLQRMLDVYEHAVWLNPQPEAHWEYHESIEITKLLMGGRMFPLTIDGLDRAMRVLTK